jgi:hypothetical protein
MEGEDGDGALRLHADKPGFSAKLVFEKEQTWVPESDAEDSIELLPERRIRWR